VVWEQFVGAGEKFDNWWRTLGIGPNGAICAGVFGEIISLRDGD
jgi:hypothetical protein